MIAATPEATQRRAAGAPTPAGRRRRIGILSEDLSGAPDEGVKKTALALALALQRDQDTLLLCTEGAPPWPDAAVVSAPRTFLSGELRAALRAYRPDVIIYVARSSTTFMSLLRTRVLKTYCPAAQVVLIGLQARRLTRWQRPLMPFVRPDRIFVQSLQSEHYLERLGCTVNLLPSGVDLATFCPVDTMRRAALRTHYGLPQGVPIALHVGHLQAGRGIRVLADLAAQQQCHVVLVASSSTDQEHALGEELRRSGVTVLSQYLPHVEHLYQLADCYVFPVQFTDHSMEVPLSVLEACACDLPIVSTRFGGLPRLFGDRGAPAFRFVDSPTDLVAATGSYCRVPERGNRLLVQPYAWEAVARHLLKVTMGDSTVAIPSPRREH